MLYSLLTVIFYAASSLGDKFISAKLKCGKQEFSLLVAASTALFLALTLPFVGWSFSFSLGSLLALAVLIFLKIAEFYTSADLLKSVSAYELKAWLSLNVLFSYLFDLLSGAEAFLWGILPCAAALLVGVGLIIFGERRTGKLKYVVLNLTYIASKLLYGMQMNALPASSPVSVLILVMAGVTLLQLPFVKPKTFLQKRGLALGALTRIPNAAGLWTEAIAAQQSLLLYSLVQPMQLLLLFVTALVQREKFTPLKLVGSILTLAAVTAMTLLIYFY